MQRQKSILSFLQKPSSENPSSGFSSYTEILQRCRLAQFPPKQLKRNPSIAVESIAPAARDLPPEVFRTETPPEKPRGRVLPSRCSVEGDVGARTLSSIMQKLSKGDELESSHDRLFANTVLSEKDPLLGVNLEKNVALKQDAAHGSISNPNYIFGVDPRQASFVSEKKKPMFLSKKWRNLLCRCNACTEFYV